MIFSDFLKKKKKQRRTIHLLHCFSFFGWWTNLQIYLILKHRHSLYSSHQVFLLILPYQLPLLSLRYLPLHHPTPHLLYQLILNSSLLAMQHTTLLLALAPLRQCRWFLRLAHLMGHRIWDGPTLLQAHSSLPPLQALPPHRALELLKSPSQGHSMLWSTRTWRHNTPGCSHPSGAPLGWPSRSPRTLGWTFCSVNRLAVF